METYRLRFVAAKGAIRALKATGLYASFFGAWRGPLFEYAEGLGLHILPVHFYSPVPVAKALPDRAGSFKIDALANEDSVRALLAKYDESLAELFAKPDKGPHDYNPENDQFSSLDAGVLYSIVRARRPARIIEIGSGSSTLVTLAAIRAEQAIDPGYHPEFVCIDPYMPSFLSPPPEGLTEVIREPLQQVCRERFRALESGDILFIDSTHVVKYGSDVVYEFLNIVPDLNLGVQIHVHDIFLPYDYPAAWIEKSRHFWNEQYLVQTMLTFGQFEIDAAVHSAFRTAALPLSAAVSEHSSDVTPASIWFRRTAN